MTIQTMRDFGIGEGQARYRRPLGRLGESRPVAISPIRKMRASSRAVPSSTIEDADRAVAAARKTLARLAPTDADGARRASSEDWRR